MNPKIFAQILEIAFQKKVSDIHFEVDNPPFFRIHGQLVRSKLPNLAAQDTEAIVELILKHNDLPSGETVRELDTSYALPGGGGRFRVSIFRQRRQYGIVMRAIPPKIATFQELNLPDVLGDIVQAQTGLVLVTGPTGNGKTTAMSSMIQFLNDTCNYNILTIEDPIEFLFTSRKSCVIQREVGPDTESFNAALKAALRMDPDVIMVGEMRDRDTIDACIKAAETGHLVFSTLHTQGAVSTINRLVGHYPPDAQEIIRHRLADILVATISLRLVLNKSGEELLPVVEVMRSTGTIQGCIRDGRLEEIDRHIASGGSLYKMQTQDQHLLQLHRRGVITMEEAKRLSRSTDLERKLITGED